jgi:hypothetical protein
MLATTDGQHGVAVAIVEADARPVAAPWVRIWHALIKKSSIVRFAL